MRFRYCRRVKKVKRTRKTKNVVSGNIKRTLQNAMEKQNNKLSKGTEITKKP